LDFDGTRAYPAYDWHGRHEGWPRISRSLVRQRGRSRQDRVNMLSAGPIRTVAAKSVPGFSQFEDAWSEKRRWAGTCMTRAPSPTPPSRCCRPSFGARPRRPSTSTAATTRWVNPLGRRLRLVEDAVDATSATSARDCTLNDGAVLDDEYLIGVSNRRQSVRDHHDVREDLSRPNARCTARFALVVEMRGRFIEHHKSRRLEQEARQRDTLLFAAAQPITTLADHGVEAEWQRLHNSQNLRGPAEPIRSPPGSPPVSRKSKFVRNES